MRRKKHTKKPLPNDHQGPYEVNRALPNDAYGPSNRQLEHEYKKRTRSWKTILKRTLIIIVTIVLLGALWVGFKFGWNLAKIFGWKNLTTALLPTKLKGENTGRVNILLAGNSADDSGHAGANLTDSIMVVSVDTKNNTAFLLSIPRDLYVSIPNNGYAKINETYQDGENDNFSESGYPKGGMGLLEKVVSQKLGLTIHYYALVDYAALENAVNAVGGITVNIQSSDPRGLYDPSLDLKTGKPLVDLSNGTQTLNGRAALNLSRARGNSYYSYGFPLSDFNRTQNQRMILIGLKDKATSVSTLSNPAKLGELADSFGDNVKTDMQLKEVRRLYSIIKKVKNSDIKSEGLNSANGKNLLGSYRTSSGQSALVPAAGLDDYTEIQAFITQLTTPPKTDTKGSQ
ncbi:MAG TPA: LCP family protein [Nevskiaceae bacterium]|nr:LCP family protein [Nevskiaceae bacterium]